MRPRDPERAKAKDAEVIRRCWQEQKQGPLQPAEKEFLATVCEKMTGDSRAHHGASP